MCHASLDPKLMMREMDHRLAAAAKARQDNDADGRVPVGLLARIGGWLTPWMRKEEAHV